MKAIFSVFFKEFREVTFCHSTIIYRIIHCKLLFTGDEWELLTRKSAFFYCSKHCYRVLVHQLLDLRRVHIIIRVLHSDEARPVCKVAHM